MNDNTIANNEDLILKREQKIEAELLLIEDSNNYIEKIESVSLELDSIVKEYIKSEHISIAEYISHEDIFNYLSKLNLDNIMI